MKTCPDCGIKKELSEFSKHNRSRTGYQKLCKPCFRAKYWTAKPRKMYDGVTCEVANCASDAVSRGMCRKHYKQVYDHGTTYEGRSRTWKPKPKPVIIPYDVCIWPANGGNRLADCYWER